MSDLTLDDYRDMVRRFDWRAVYADLYPDYDASDPDYFARCTEQDYYDGEESWAFQPEVRHHPDDKKDELETVPAIIDRALTLTEDEAQKMDAAWDALSWQPAWEEAQNAALRAAKDASRFFALTRAWDAARVAAWDAVCDPVWDAILATMTKDLIDPEQYELLMSPWRAVTDA